MSLPDETLRKILFQIQATALQSQKEFSLSQQQIAAEDRERRKIELTLKELQEIKGDVNMYKGVGKMFMMVPRKEMEGDLKAQEKDIADDIVSLQKKSKYLEKQFNDAQGQLRDILHHAPKAGS